MPEHSDNPAEDPAVEDDGARDAHPAEAALDSVEQAASAVESAASDAPGPDAPGPDAPGPDAPGPDAPGPDAPGPGAPGPSAPGPGAPAPAAGTEQAVALPDFGTQTAIAAAAASGIGLLDDVSLRVKIELGRTHMYVEDVLHLGTDSIIELDKAAGDPVDIYVNDRHIARGEVLVLNENFCVRVSEIISTAPHEE